MSIEIWKLTASLPCASSSGDSSRLASQMISGGMRWPGKCRKTPSRALAWQSALQVRTFGTAEPLTGSGGGDEVSMVLWIGCGRAKIWIQVSSVAALPPSHKATARQGGPSHISGRPPSVHPSYLYINGKDCFGGTPKPTPNAFGMLPNSKNPRKLVVSAVESIRGKKTESCLTRSTAVVAQGRLAMCGKSADLPLTE